MMIWLLLVSMLVLIECMLVVGLCVVFCVFGIMVDDFWKICIFISLLLVICGLMCSVMLMFLWLNVWNGVIEVDVFVCVYELVVIGMFWLIRILVFLLLSVIRFGVDSMLIELFELSVDRIVFRLLVLLKMLKLLLLSCLMFMFESVVCVVVLLMLFVVMVVIVLVSVSRLFELVLKLVLLLL